MPCPRQQYFHCWWREGKGTRAVPPPPLPHRPCVAKGSPGRKCEAAGLALHRPSLHWSGPTFPAPQESQNQVQLRCKESRSFKVIMLTSPEREQSESRSHVHTVSLSHCVPNITTDRLRQVPSSLYAVPVQWLSLAKTDGAIWGPVSMSPFIHHFSGCLPPSSAFTWS